jgi:thiamine biosynthesis lipoprotein
VVLSEQELFDRMSGAALTEQARRALCRCRFRALGTPCQLQFSGPLARAGPPVRDQEALRWLADFEARYSRYRPDSLVSLINDSCRRRRRLGAGRPARPRGLFQLCDWYHWLTRGLFDPTTLPLLRLLGLSSGSPSCRPTPDRELSAGARPAWAGVGWSGNRARCACPNAAWPSIWAASARSMRWTASPSSPSGRGPAATCWWTSATTCASAGAARERALAHRSRGPAEPGRCWTGVAVTDHAVCTSGGYLRRVEHAGRSYGHILDPRTGQPIRHALPRGQRHRPHLHGGGRAGHRGLHPRAHRGSGPAGRPPPGGRLPDHRTHEIPEQEIP